MIERYQINQEQFDAALKNLCSAKDMPPSSGVYLMVNVQTGRMYVGRSKNMRRRCGVHISEMRSGIKDIRIQEDYAKYGEESMKFSVLVQRTDPLEIFWCEWQAIKIAYSRDCYNKLGPSRCLDEPANCHEVKRRLAAC